MAISDDELEIFYKNYSEFKDRDKEIFSRLVNKLLSKTFIVCSLKDDYNDYYDALRLFKTLNIYFNVIDYDLYKDEVLKLIHIKTSKDRNRVHLNKLDTILCLIFRLTYFKKIKEVDLANDVYIEVSEIYDELNKTQIYNSPKTLGEVERSLINLRRNKIIDFNSKITPEATIKILPTIQLVVNVTNLSDLINQIKAYVNESEDNEGEEESEDLDENQID